jgi:hypothetical protein
MTSSRSSIRTYRLIAKLYRGHELVSTYLFQGARRSFMIVTLASDYYLVAIDQGSPQLELVKQLLTRWVTDHGYLRMIHVGSLEMPTTDKLKFPTLELYLVNLTKSQWTEFSGQLSKSGYPLALLSESVVINKQCLIPSSFTTDQVSDS